MNGHIMQVLVYGESSNRTFKEGYPLYKLCKYVWRQGLNRFALKLGRSVVSLLDLDF